MQFRKPSYLSPSALACWEECGDEYFFRYIVPKDIRPTKPPQTSPMSVGSAFDALVKNRLYRLFYGDAETKREGYLLRDLVAKQCEEHTLPESLVIAIDVFEQYLESGAYNNLVALIRESSVLPRMEFDVTKKVRGVPLLGKPDLHFQTIFQADCIVDWKVSGSVSVHGVSPQQGFMSCLTRDGKSTSHRKFDPEMHPGGVMVNRLPMNETTDYWADQLATYAWCLDEDVGSTNFIVRIEQLACRPCPKSDDSGRLRVKSCVHQSIVDRDYQFKLIERYRRCWEHVVAGHYFPDLTLSESNARADLLVKQLLNPPDIATMQIGTLPSIEW